MILINMVSFVICSLSAVACLVGRSQMGFIACAALAAMNGWFVYTHFVGV